MMLSACLKPLVIPSREKHIAKQDKDKDKSLLYRLIENIVQTNRKHCIDYQKTLYRLIENMKYIVCIKFLYKI